MGESGDLTMKWTAIVDHRGWLVAEGDVPSMKSEQGYTYRIRCRDGFAPTLVGASHVLYIGMSGTGRSGRVESLWSGKHSANRGLYHIAVARIRAGLEALRVEVEVHHHAHPGLAEVSDLHHFTLVHGHPPVLNGRWEGYLAGRALEIIAKQAGVELLNRPYDLSVPGDPPRAVATIANFVGQPWRGSLVWVWPAGWTGRPASEWDGRLLWLDPAGTLGLPETAVPGVAWLAEARIREWWEGELLTAEGEPGAFREWLDTLVNDVATTLASSRQGDP
jgi:hypothetical protein